MKIKNQHRIAALITLIFATAVLASNGTHNSSLSPAAAGIGGVSQGTFISETEALYRNPALIGDRLTGVWKPDAEISATFGKHNSQGALVNGSTTLPSYSPSNDKLLILPSAATAMKVHDTVAVGLGFVTMGGSVIDYTGNATLSEQKSEQNLFRLLPGVSVAPAAGIKLGASLVVGYNTLALNSAFPPSPQSHLGPKSAWAIGGLLGVNVVPAKGVRLGASYLTKTKFNFKELYDLGQLGGVATGSLKNVTIQEPAEFATGIAYDVADWTFSFDYRNIGWSSAAGYSELGWNSQNVFSVGVQYHLGVLTLRGGVVYGKSPIPNATDINGDETFDFQGTTVLRGLTAEMNVIGLTAITEWEADLGAGYRINDQLTLDLAFNFLPSVTVTQSGTMISVGGPFAASSKVSEWAVVAGASYQF